VNEASKQWRIDRRGEGEEEVNGDYALIYLFGGRKN
jgi:hypothetical protein